MCHVLASWENRPKPKDTNKHKQKRIKWISFVLLRRMFVTFQNKGYKDNKILLLCCAGSNRER